MKKFLAFLLMFLMIFFASTSFSETRWLDHTLPLDRVVSAEVLRKVVPDETSIIMVGKDIPAGLYGIAGFKFDNSPDIEVAYMVVIMRGDETVYQSELLHTRDNADLILPLFDGDCLIVVTQFNDIVYLYSLDYSALKLY